MSLGCQVDAGLSDSDPMTPTVPEAGPVTDCTTCYDALCAWETLECNADPGCAAWMTCARGCSSIDEGPSSCFGQCEEPASSTGKKLRDVFSRCVSQNKCCGAEGEFLDDAGPVSSDAPDPKLAPCAADGCGACLLVVKEGKCGEDSCAGTLEACSQDSDVTGASPCWNHLTACDQQSEGCSSAVPASSVTVTSQSLACVAAHCPECIPDRDPACTLCQLTACPDEMGALLGSFEAQELLRCRSACPSKDDPTACNQACFSDHEDGKTIVVELYSCTQNACKSPCAGL
jgi:hypothetical protein